MATLFKDLYSEAFYKQFAQSLTKVLPKFNSKQFIKLIFSDEFEGYELKQRMTHTCKVMDHFMPEDFKQATKVIQKLIEDLVSRGIKEESVEFMFLPEYIEMKGLDDYQTSVEAFEFITQFTSCEFAVRPFIVRYQDEMLAQMFAWTKHDHHMVRRLASEGSRPRLPWAMALPSLKKNPELIEKILSALKDDEYEIVRRSVANNLNDVSKDNPQYVIDFATEWLGKNKKLDALIKHACRTLLKDGNQNVLRLFGFDSKHFELDSFTCEPSVNLGDNITFNFRIKNKSTKCQLARIEYGIYYLKKNGDLSRKVFKISERELNGKEVCEFERKQSFKYITTRKFYTGLHKVSVIINGLESEALSFELCS